MHPCIPATILHYCTFQDTVPLDFKSLCVSLCVSFLCMYYLCEKCYKPNTVQYYIAQSQRKAMPKNVQTTTLLHSSHTLAKECSKSPSLQQQANRELLDAHVGFRKHRVSRQQIANNCWITEKAREFQKNIYFCFTD